MTYQADDKVTISNQTLIHVVDHESYMADVIVTRCEKIGFAHVPHPMADKHCRKCQENGHGLHSA